MITLINSVTLYQADVRGQLRQWTIGIDPLADDTIVIIHGIAGGALQTKTEHVSRGLGGRTLAEQVASRVRSRVNKSYDRGYKDTPEQALALRGTNALGMYKPMLAQPLKKVKGINYNNAFAQFKLDGHRCLITKSNGKTFAYSRQGKLITSIGHILDEVVLREGQTVDGELYCHGVSLQTIGSWIKREQEATVNLSYHAYDFVAAIPYESRLQYIEAIFNGNRHSNVVETVPVSSEEEVHEYFRHSRKNGYEGAIIRWGNAGYEFGKRSSSLVKVKHFQDEEFLVNGIIPSKDGWARLVCVAPNKELFTVSAPGTIEEKKQILENRERYIGKHVTIEFANWTADGLPFHPTAIRFREDI